MHKDSAEEDQEQTQGHTATKWKGQNLNLGLTEYHTCLKHSMLSVEQFLCSYKRANLRKPLRVVTYYEELLFTLKRGEVTVLKG